VLMHSNRVIIFPCLQKHAQCMFCMQEDEWETETKGRGLPGMRERGCCRWELLSRQPMVRGGEKKRTMATIVFPFYRGTFLFFFLSECCSETNRGKRWQEAEEEWRWHWQCWWRTSAKDVDFSSSSACFLFPLFTPLRFLFLLPFIHPQLPFVLFFPFLFFPLFSSLSFIFYISLVRSFLLFFFPFMFLLFFRSFSPLYLKQFFLQSLMFVP